MSNPNDRGEQPGGDASDASVRSTVGRGVVISGHDVDAGALPPISVDPALASAPVEEAAPRVEGYELIDRLGQGGMGTVWRARQLSTHREVAVKFLSGGAFGSEAARRRFEREVELAGQLQHPYITRLYHSGIHQGVYFYAMELVEGEPLTDYVRRQGLTPRQALGLMRKVCEAVDYAHQQGVIHRDLKPSNILIDAAGDPHLLDFGLARSQWGADMATLSVDGSAIGTLAYMAPEQAAGHNSRVDTRADVYSLGVMLFELLTKELPHEPSGSHFERQRRIVEQEARRPRSINKTIDPDLDALVSKALAHLPAHRYTTAGELASDLSNYLNHEPIQARPLTLGYLLRKRMRKHRGRFAAVAVIGALLVALLSYSYVQVHVERDRAQQEADAAERSLYLTRLALARKALDGGDWAEARSVLDHSSDELRRWEWHRLRYEADQSVQVFDRHRASVSAVAIDDDLVTSIDRHGHAYRWSMRTGQIADYPTVFPAGVQQTITADGRLAAFAVSDGVGLYATATGERFAQLDTTERSVQGVALAPDGRHVAVVIDGTIEIWDAPFGSDPIRTYAAASDARHVTFGAAGRLAFSVNDEIWTIDLQEDEARQIGAAASAVRDLAWSAESDRLASVDAAGAVVIIDLSGSEPMTREIGSVEGRGTALALDPQGRFLAGATVQGAITLWHLDTGTREGTYIGHGSRVTSLRFTADGERFVSASADGTVRAWRVGRSAKGYREYSIEGHAPVIGFQFDPAGRLLTAGDTAGSVHFYEHDQAAWRTLHEAEAPVRALAFHPMDRQLAIAYEQSVHLWRLDSTPKPMGVFSPLTELAGFTWVPHHNQFVIAPYPVDGALLEAWSLDELDGLDELNKHEWSPAETVAGSRHVAVDQAARQALTISPDGRSLILYSLPDWKIVARLPVKHAPARMAALSPNGRLAAVLGAGQRVCIWDMRRRTHLTTIEPYGSGHVGDMIFGPDGDRLITAGSTVRIWDVLTGTNVLELSIDRPTNFFAVAFDAEADEIRAGGEGAVVSWYTR